MERLKEWIDPDKFSHLSIAKTSSDYIKSVFVFVLKKILIIKYLKKFVGSTQS